MKAEDGRRKPKANKSTAEFSSMRADVTRRADAAKLRELDLEAHLADPSIRQQFVTPMFDAIAPRYDRFTRVFSFGMDRGWKDELLAEATRSAPADATVLDLACGTGDLALDIARLLPSARVTGVDASAAMIDLAEARRVTEQAGSVAFTVGDMSALQLPDASVDLITSGYGFRNVPDYRVALREAARVLKPGGRLVTLDFYRPGNALYRRAVVGYLTLAGNVVGWLWHRVPVVYGYIGPSVQHFVSSGAFAESLVEARFTVNRVNRKLLGVIAIHSAQKQ
jgi:demethylmenaquinone methyltransferase/2-methoxy-6-polyprenyl-1,4-benzoquinol methylase